MCSQLHNSFWSLLASVPPKYIVCYLGVEYLESDGLRLIREVRAVPLTSRQLSRPTPGAPNLANRPTVFLSYFLLWVCYETQRQNSETSWFSRPTRGAPNLCITISSLVSQSQLVDCPTQLICTWIFIRCSMTKLKEHSREICYTRSQILGIQTSIPFPQRWKLSIPSVPAGV